MLDDSNGSTEPASGPHKGSYYEEACALADGSADEPTNDAAHDEDVFWEMGNRGSPSEPRGSAAIEDDDSEAEPERETAVVCKLVLHIPIGKEYFLLIVKARDLFPFCFYFIFK